MKLLLTALFILPFSISAQEPTYMNNDGFGAPETLDQAVEEGRIQKEEAVEMQKEEAVEMQKEEAEEMNEEDMDYEQQEDVKTLDDYEKQEDVKTDDMDVPEATLTPDADAQQMQEEEEQRIEDNYLIGPYNGKGEFTLPKKEDKTPEP